MCGGIKCIDGNGLEMGALGLHCLPGGSAPSIRAHTTTKGSLVSYMSRCMTDLEAAPPFSFYLGHVPVIAECRASGRLLNDLMLEW